MTNIIVKTMTPVEAADIMRQAGIRTSQERVRAGIKQGVYKWGECIMMDGPNYTVYSKLFFAWLNERAEKVEET